MTKKRKQPKAEPTAATPIYLPDGRVVGRVVGNDFVKSLRSSVHMLRRPRGWALDLDTLDQAREVGATRVVIRDLDTSTTYTAAVADILKYGVTVRRGHGDQVALPLTRWSVSRRPGAAVVATAPAEPVQLALL